MCVCTYAYICVYTYAYVYIHTYKHRETRGDTDSSGTWKAAISDLRARMPPDSFARNADGVEEEDSLSINCKVRGYMYVCMVHACMYVRVRNRQ